MHEHNHKPDIDIYAVLKSSYEKALNERGKANILIAGKTGVGKSTLINAVFQGKMATTGQGKPITQSTTKYTKEGIPVAIYDTKGIEVKDYQPILKELMGYIGNCNKSSDPLEHIHVAWVCIAEGSRRVEEAEVLLAKQLYDLNLSVVIVITTASSDQGFRSIVQQQFPFAANVVRVNSIGLPLDGGIIMPPYGLEDLIDLTMEVIPEAQKKAFAAAQRIKIDTKVKQAHICVATAAASAAAAGAVPIPLSDAVLIVPIQLTMLAGISVTFGLDVTVGFLSSLIAGTFTSLGGTLAGRALVGELIKLIPGAGSLVGGAISASVAATLTTAFGEAYVATLYSLLKDSPDKQLSGDEVAAAFKAKLSIQ